MNNSYNKCLVLCRSDLYQVKCIIIVVLNLLPRSFCVHKVPLNYELQGPFYVNSSIKPVGLCTHHINNGTHAEFWGLMTLDTNYRISTEKKNYGLRSLTCSRRRTFLPLS